MGYTNRLKKRDRLKPYLYLIIVCLTLLSSGAFYWTATLYFAYTDEINRLKISKAAVVEENDKLLAQNYFLVGENENLLSRIQALTEQSKAMLEQVTEMETIIFTITELIGLTPEDNPADDPEEVEEDVFPGLFINIDLTHPAVIEVESNHSELDDCLPDIYEALVILHDEAEVVAARPAIYPAKGRITSYFGMRRIPYRRSGYQFHTGIDIANSQGTQIVSTAPGVIIYAGYSGSYGRLIVIDHGHDYQTYYAHLQEYIVYKGQQVERGQTIGYMGKSGRTTGVHLHYEVRIGGHPVNPVCYLGDE